MIFKHPGMLTPGGGDVIADISPPQSPYGAFIVGFYKRIEENGGFIQPTTATFDRSAYKEFLKKLMEYL